MSFARALRYAVLALAFARALDAIAMNIDDGGEWNAVEDDDVREVTNDGRCDVRRMSADEVGSGERVEPVVVIDARRAREIFLFRENTRKATLLRTYGDREITLSSADTYSSEKRRMTLREYVEKGLKPVSGDARANETFYWFGDHVDDRGTNGLSELFASYERLAFVPRDADVAYSFGIGGPMSGVPLHVHGPGWSETIHGRKLWFLAPPEPAPLFDPNVTAYAWASERVRLGTNGDMLQCVVSAGEAIYFPNAWWHATLNLDETVFMSSFVNYARKGGRESGGEL